MMAPSLLLALLFSGLLGWGLYSGNMPMKTVECRQAEKPILFWCIATIYTGFIALLLAIAFES